MWHIIGASLSEPTLAWSTRPRASTDRPTDQLTIHVILICCTWPRHAHVNSAVRNRDSYKTENIDDGKAKSRDTRATDCEAGTIERSANLFILALSCQCRHASLGFTYVSFSRRSLHTCPFSLSYKLEVQHVHAHGIHRPHPLA